VHKGLIHTYIEMQALVLAPIAPHWCEYLWLEILKKPSSIQLSSWPQVPATDASLTAAREYVRNTSYNINSAEGQMMKKQAKGKAMLFDPKKPKKLTIFLSTSFPAWQDKYIDLLREMWDPDTKTIKNDELMARVKKMGEMKKAMPFVQNLKQRLSAEDVSKVLDRKLAFDEHKTLLAMVPGIKRAAGCLTVDVVVVTEGSKKGVDITNGNKDVDVTALAAEQAIPGQPTYLFENVEV